MPQMLRAIVAAPADPFVKRDGHVAPQSLWRRHPQILPRALRRTAHTAAAAVRHAVGWRATELSPAVARFRAVDDDNGQCPRGAGCVLRCTLSNCVRLSVCLITGWVLASPAAHRVCVRTAPSPAARRVRTPACVSRACRLPFVCESHQGATGALVASPPAVDGRSHP